MSFDYTKAFYEVDNFCIEYSKIIEKNMITSENKNHIIKSSSTSMLLSEVMLINIWFHSSGFRNFKHFYLYLQQNYRNAFTKLVSYNRFVEIKQMSILPLYYFLQLNSGQKTKIQYIDATSIAVCKNKRIGRNKVFKDLAKRGKTTMGYFFGFKLHFIVNEFGEILSFILTPGNVHDIKVLNKISKNLTGKIFGDKAYISKEIFNELYDRGLKLVTTLRAKMKNKMQDLTEKILLRKRSIIETINDQLKNIQQVEHSRHRSPTNFLENLLSALAAYYFQPKKPAINFKQKTGENMLCY